MLILLLMLVFLVPESSQISNCECNDEIYSTNYTEQQLKSPNYPKHRCPNLNCSYLIDADLTLALELHLHDVFTTDGHYFEVYQHLEYNGTAVFMYENLRKGDKASLDDDTMMLSYSTLHASVGVGFLVRFVTNGNPSDSRFTVTFKRTANVRCEHPLRFADTTRTLLPIHKGFPHEGCLFRITMEPSRILHVISKNDGPQYQSSFLVEARIGNTLQWRNARDRNMRKESSEPLDLWIRLGSLHYWSRWDHAEQISVQYFSLDFEPCACDSPPHLIGVNESIVSISPGFPNTYCAPLKCSFDFSLAPSSSNHNHTVFVVNLIYMGRDNGDALKIRIDGRLEPISLRNQISNHTLVLAGSNMSFIFNSGSERSNHGYRLEVRRDEVPNECLCPSVETKQLLASGSMPITIPAHCHLMTCRFKIGEFSQHNFRMKTSYYMESEDEYLRFVSDNSEMTFTKEDEPSIVHNWLVTTSKVYIEYKRIEDERAGNRRDSFFNITWKWSGACDCDAENMTATNDWNHFVSPDYPQDYCPDMDCKYAIAAPENHCIVVNISEFYTEPYHDVLTISEGTGDNITIIRRLEGKRFVPDLIQSTGNVLDFRFQSDHAGTEKGYVIFYKAVSVDDKTKSKGSISIAMIIIIGITVLLAVIAVTLHKRNVFRSANQPVVRFENSGGSASTSLRSINSAI